MKGLYMGYYKVKSDKAVKAKASCSILNIGCGNSTMSEEMYDEGYLSITNNDISESCIENMKKRNEKRPEMKWDVMDVRDMSYPDSSFDMIIDKSTLDCLNCGDKGPINITL